MQRLDQSREEEGERSERDNAGREMQIQRGGTAGGVVLVRETGREVRGLYLSLRAQTWHTER